MIAVCDMGPLHYLVLIGCDHILPRIFERVITARIVIEHDYIGGKARAVIESMNQRDKERKLPKKRPPPE